MCEEKIFRCPVCDSVLEFSFDDDDENNTLRCKCPDCGLTGCDARRYHNPKSKAIAYFSLCMDIPLEFFLNKIAMRLQETKECFSKHLYKTTQKHEHIKPCPYCGQSPDVIVSHISDEYKISIKCSNEKCQHPVKTKEYLSLGQATKYWNDFDFACSPDPNDKY